MEPVWPTIFRRKTTKKKAKLLRKYKLTTGEKEDDRSEVEESESEREREVKKCYFHIQISKHAKVKVFF